MPRCLLVFEPPDGGVAEHVRQLALALPGRGVDVTVAGPAEARIYDELEAEGVDLVRLPFGRDLRAADYARAAARIRALAASGRFDLMHVHSTKAGAIARPAAALARLPVVYTPHCFAFVGPQSRRRVVAAVAVERLLAPLTARTVCVADAERRDARRRQVGDPARTVVVHNGTAPCPPDLDPDHELEAFAAGGPLAACITALRPQKAVDDFVRAAPAILSAVPEARLAVIGDGEEREGLERLAGELALGDRLRFFGFRAPAARQLGAIDLFVLPSRWEAFPISLLEAMACGVPQVATDVGGTAEAVEDGVTGLLCPAEDPAALALAVSGLLADRERRQAMGAASRQRHAEHFRAERMVGDLAAIYRGVADLGATLAA